MRHRSVVTAIAAIALCAGLATSCGGGARGSAGPGTPSESSEDGVITDSKLISAEDLDAVSTYFERKRNVISRCFTDAMDSGEVEEKVREMYLTVTVTVYPGGKARNARFSDASTRSESVESCVRERIDSWTLPSVKQAFDYSHRYGFREL
jgi:hypothetical protein